MSIEEYISKRRGTGSHDFLGPYKTITYPFGKYVITIKLTLANEFVGVEEVKLNTEFITYKQKLSPKGYHDIDDLYHD